MRSQRRLPFDEPSPPSPGAAIERFTAAAIKRSRRRRPTTLRQEVEQSLARPRREPSLDEINRLFSEAQALR